MPQDSHLRAYKDNEALAVGAVASAARTTTGTGSAFATPNLDNINALLVITVASGTTPTLDLTLETTADGTNYYAVQSFPQQTTTNAGVARIFGPLGLTCRWSWVIAGTTPSFTFSVATTADRDN